MNYNNTNTIALRDAHYTHTPDLARYVTAGGFEAFRKAIGMAREDLIGIIESSGLRGRGGAGFPTGLKWKFTAAEAEPEKYVIANADEGEPGTFKDRYIMERAPYRFIEGLMISAIAIGAEDAFIYIRHEYTRSIRVLQEAMAQLYQAGLLGTEVAGSSKRLDMELVSGAGSYLCGDETTLLESMEGKRGNPRYKPPFPAQKGFRSKPSVVNNVETLAHVPDIVMHGADWYRRFGTEKSPGTKLYCLSGRVNRPGVYELPMGTPLRTLIEEHGGGMKEGYELKGALLGGAAGTFVDTSLLDVPMDFDHLKAEGATLGSGAVIIISNEDRIPFMLENILDFFKHESCGKCVPCRIGCMRLTEMIRSVRQNGALAEGQISAMEKESAMMASTSLCGLGQSPILPVRSAFKYFLHEFIA